MVNRSNLRIAAQYWPTHSRDGDVHGASRRRALDILENRLAEEFNRQLFPATSITALDLDAIRKYYDRRFLHSSGKVAEVLTPWQMIAYYLIHERGMHGGQIDEALGLPVDRNGKRRRSYDAYRLALKKLDHIQG